jgi:hypothetical protein
MSTKHVERVINNILDSPAPRKKKLQHHERFSTFEDEDEKTQDKDVRSTSTVDMLRSELQKHSDLQK